MSDPDSPSPESSINLDPAIASLSQIPHLAMGLSMSLDKPTTRQAFCKSPSKPRPVDHCEYRQMEVVVYWRGAEGTS